MVRPDYGFILITLVVISVSVVVVATRNRSVWFQSSAGIAMSLMVPSMLALFVAMPRQGRPGQIIPMLFVPPVCAALSMVWATRRSSAQNVLCVLKRHYR